ncbi:MAG: hypothetical protein ACQESF_01900 [Nanobdellota archaeon]
MDFGKNIYDIIFEDILNIPELYENGILNNCSSESPGCISFKENVTDIVNNIDSSLMDLEGTMRRYRQTVSSKFGSYNMDVANSRLLLCKTSGDLELNLEKKMAMPLFDHLKSDSGDLQDILLRNNTSIEALEQTCNDRFQEKTKSNREDSQYLQNRKKVKVDKGFIQFFPFEANRKKKPDSVKSLPKDLQYVALEGRVKYFPSSIEKICRKTAEYITKEAFFFPEDKKKMEPLEKYVVKNDLIGFKLIFSHPEMFHDKRLSRMGLSAFRRCCKGHGMVGKESYKKITEHGFSKVSDLTQADVSYYDCRGNKPYEFEAQITDVLRYSIIDICGERSHNLHKQRMKYGLRDDFFYQETVEKIFTSPYHTWNSRENIKKQMRSKYREVYNFLINRFENFFMEEVKNAYGVDDANYLPHFLSFDRKNYMNLLTSD